MVKPGGPYPTIQAAADVAGPGDTVLISPGVYRERVSPVRSGQPGLPITFRAPEGRVYIRGSEQTPTTAWVGEPAKTGVFRLPLSRVPTGTVAYSGRCDERLYGKFNPFHRGFNATRAARPHEVAIAELQTRLSEIESKLEAIDPVDIAFAGLERRRMLWQTEIDEMTRDRRLLRTRGQVFVDSHAVAQADSLEELFDLPGRWCVDERGEFVLLHVPEHVDPLAGTLIELTVRHTVFSPLVRGLGHIRLEGLVIEHAANHFPSWGAQGWPQVGALSTRSGHHWTIDRCTVRHANAIGIDCGSEGDVTHMEFPGERADLQVSHHKQSTDTGSVGHHLIQGCTIEDNGHCGIAGIRHTGTRVLHNVIRRNNAGGWSSPWWEFAGIKFHFCFDALIEGNLIADNDAHGVWLDNQVRGTRVTRNVIINNCWSGINVELHRGEVLIDNNVIAHTRQGDGVYAHDASDITVAHNLIYANANFGVWMAYATPRVKPEDGCWDNRVLNNLIIGNRAGAVGLPLPWDCAGRNVCDHNVYVGAGEYLDEGSGPQPPRFVLTNRTHCGSMPHVLGKTAAAQTTEVVLASLTDALARSGIEHRPDARSFADTCQIDLELWRGATGFDRHSVLLSVLRDALGRQDLRWQFSLPRALDPVVPVASGVASIERDFENRPYSASPIPGPFQHIRAGNVRVPLWPVRARMPRST